MGSVLYVFWPPGGAYVEGNAEGKVEGNPGGNAEGNAKCNAKGNAEGNAGGILSFTNVSGVSGEYKADVQNYFQHETYNSFAKKICLPREMSIMIHPGILVQTER